MIMKILKNPAIEQVKLDNSDVIIIFFLCIISYGIHFWQIQFPACVIFDEVHFGNFTNWYTRNEFFFDIHPPFGKMIMYWLSYLAEYPAEIEFGGEYGHPYPDETYLCIRIVPPLFSAMCVPLIYLTVRFASFGQCGAVAAASIILFDTSMACEHRFILSDGMLHFFCALHLCILSYSLSIPRYTTKFRIWQIAAGISLGAACTCKNTAWGLTALNGIIHIVELLLEYQEISLEFITELFIRGITLAGLALATYITAFSIHFVLTPFYGQGVPYLPQHMKSQLIEDKTTDETVLWGTRVKGHSLIYRSIELTIIMHKGNMQINAWHPYQSRPIGWPLLTDIFVAFWSKDGHEVTCIGNAFSYYIAFIGVWSLVFGIAKDKFWIAIRFTIGWAVSYFPFFLIPRVMYLYHYLIPLMLGACAFGASIELYCDHFSKGLISCLCVFLCLVGFILWSPYVYGYVPWDKTVTLWNDNWANGDAYHRELAAKSGKGSLFNTKGVRIY